MQNLHIYNTLTSKKEELIPLKEGKVRIYSCGPTVYDFAHIGNFRSFLLSDLLVRVLRYIGLEVEKVQNITDVGHLISDHDEGEDKILKKAKLENKDPFAIARFFEEAFIEDEDKLKIIPPNHRPRATDYIEGQIKWCEELIKKGYAYEKNGSVYFKISKFSTYGELSKNKLEDLMAGARVKENSEKEDPHDFALWRHADSNHLMQWDSPWGRGFPGWHIECSVMSHTLLGFPFDIHTGGEDNKFPHHECEIAQNEAYCGERSVKYWMHTKHLLVDDQKMSKSLGNFFTLRDVLEKGYSGNEVRYLLLSAHYRTALNFTFQGLEMARSSIARLEEARRIFGEISSDASEEEGTLINKHKEAFKDALLDDLNVADALAATFELIRSGMKLRDEGNLSAEDAKSIVNFLEGEFNIIFDVLNDKDVVAKDDEEGIEALIKKRNEYRKEGKWKEADQIRDSLFKDKEIKLIDDGENTSYRVVKK